VLAGMGVLVGSAIAPLQERGRAVSASRGSGSLG
jgi:hypothetical protein